MEVHEGVIRGGCRNYLAVRIACRSRGRGSKWSTPAICASRAARTTSRVDPSGKTPSALEPKRDVDCAPDADGFGVRGRLGFIEMDVERLVVAARDDRFQSRTGGILQGVHEGTRTLTIGSFAGSRRSRRMMMARLGEASVLSARKSIEPFKRSAMMKLSRSTPRNCAISIALIVTGWPAHSGRRKLIARPRIVAACQ